ncbi:hypothetical protein [Micromonospora sonneratiae]|uniref:Uncharacterized protein n=1 Tax=Micromonospora sonneratiae TaxID=1184706 RepID=A0ABW3YGB2_9ACTN
MSEPKRRKYADYLPAELREQAIEAAPFGTPRPGHGTVYLYPLPDGTTWLGTWSDEYPEPTPNGERVGQEMYEGTRDAVVAWAKARPVTHRLIFSPDDDSYRPLAT